ncbi:WSSV604 [White spot syndrome virus]|uniref:WSSV604 n=1 Tax=White spot syndrome virus TaxID=342409 RepID=A0A2I6SCM5_9VIRU|nr:WSSV604 [White spot syndrome virus]
MGSLKTASSRAFFPLNIKSITTKIVIDAINQPVRKMLVDHLYHFKEMQNVVEKYKDDSDEKLSVILKSKKSQRI